MYVIVILVWRAKPDKLTLCGSLRDVFRSVHLTLLDTVQNESYIEKQGYINTVLGSLLKKHVSLEYQGKERMLAHLAHLLFFELSQNKP